MVASGTQASISLFEDTLDHLKEGIAVFDRNDRLVVFNKAYGQLFESFGFPLRPGITVTEIAAAALFTVYPNPHEDDNGLGLADPGLTNYYAATGQSFLRQSRDGRVLSVVYSRTGDGGTLVSWTDVTEQQQHLQSLREREEYLRQTLETVSEGVIGIDEDGVIEIYNAAAERIFGYRANETIGRNVNMLMTAADREAHAGYLRRYLTTGTARIVGIGRDVVGRRKDGENFPMVLAIGEVRTAHGVRFIGTIRDLTKTREIESQLRHAQKMKAIGQLTGGIAHDFNNLLTVILGNLRALESRDDLSPAGENRVAAALRATKQAGDLTRRLLDFSRPAALELVTVDPAVVVHDVCEMLRPILGRHISLQTQIDANINAIRVDSAQLQNALVNLAINARDAMSGRGCIIFTVRPASLKEREMSANILTELEDVIVIAVEDDGAGMSPEVMERAAEPFFTTKEIGEGSGLGLSIVYGFAEQAGGDVQMESQAGIGTVVRLLLPAVRKEESQPERQYPD